MPPENVEDIYRLSPVQQGMLFHTLASPRTGMYLEQFSPVYREGFEPELFLRAWQQTLDRHPLLRTAFLWEDLKEPFQIVYRRVELTVDRQDWRGLPGEEVARRLRAYLEADRRRGFDLARPPLLRLGLLRMADVEYRVIWSYHHLLLDGWSAGLLMREILELCQAAARGETFQPTPRRPFKDYVKWLRQQDLASAEAYWRRVLAGFTNPTSLEIDRSSAATPAEPGYQLRLLRVEAATTARLRAFAQRHRLTLSTLVQGAWAMLLARYSGEQDVVYGLTVSGRPPALKGVESMLGCFINTLPVRLRVRPEEDLLAWLRGVQSGLAELRRYEHTPPLEVLGWSQVPRGRMLFESIVVFEAFTAESAFGADLSGVFQRTNYPLTLTVSPDRDMTLRLGFEPHRFAATAVARMLRHLESLLAGIDAAPMARLAALPLLTAGERQQLLREWNDTRDGEAGERAEAVRVAADGGEETILELIAAQAARTPRALAVSGRGGSLAYGELEDRASRLARRLEELGVGPESRVGLCLERGLEMVVALLAVWKAGGAYVPLDPAYPDARLATMLEDAQPCVLLTEVALAPRLSGSCSVDRGRLLCLDEEPGVEVAEVTKGAPGRDPARPGRVAAGAENLAYVIYTSGSTGRPKGVEITQRGLANFMRAMARQPGLAAGDVMLAVTTLGFDIAGLELLLPLVVGARVVVAGRGVGQDPAQLGALLASSGATVLQATPATWRLLLEAGWPGARELKALCGGEALPWELASRLRARVASLWNLYGPTETTVYSAVGEVGEEEGQEGVVALGRPIANTTLWVVDRQLEAVPVGVVGELAIGGGGLARGYLGRAELTAERFVPNPFAGHGDGGTRLYRTGDLVRRRPEGGLEFLGRMDHQVKVRGFRVELGEIEAVLLEHPAVQAAAVVAREGAGGGRGEVADRRLVAYVVRRAAPGSAAGPAVARAAGSPAETAGGAEPADSPPTFAELRDFLERRLPAYMVPSAFVALPALPLSAAGKVDRRALPQPERLQAGVHESSALPRDEAERVIAGTWQEVLEIERLGIEDDFFALGGHSLLQVRAANRLRQALGKDLPLAVLLQHRTVAGLAQAISDFRASPAVSPAVSLEELRQDAVLGPEVRPAGGGPRQRDVEPAAVLLTGATGFVGAHLLSELLHQTRADVYCLVRASDPEQGAGKLRRELANRGLWDEAIGARIRPVVGDLARPALGLTESGFQALAGAVDVIYHTGAAVNLLAAYTVLRPANVLGTRELLRLACSGEVKPLHYVSTLRVLDSDAYAADGVACEEEPLRDCQGLPGGYLQSKWVAERLVAAARQRGIPGCIFRPGTISGDSRTGFAKLDDFAFQMIKGMIQLGAAPAAEVKVDWTPVDFVGRAIVWLSRQRDCFGKTFHLINPQPLPAAEMTAWMRQAGYPLEELPPDRWRALLIERVGRGEENALSTFLSLFEEAAARGEMAIGRVRYDCHQTCEALARGPLRYPPVDGQMLATAFSYFIRSGFLPAPLRERALSPAQGIPP